MDIGRLRALRELATRETMAAAADALFLSPSAVSQQIAQLQEEVGVPLTERRGRGVRLTPAGCVLVGHIERIMAVLDEAKSELAALKLEVAGDVRVAAFPSIAVALLPHAIKQLRSKYPRLSIVFDELEPADGLAALGSWQADVALIDDMSILLGKQKNIEHVRLTEDVLYALLPVEHKFAQRESVSVAELRDERWALDSASSTYSEFIVNLCRRAGYEPALNAKCRGFEMVAAMVASECSISVVPGLRLASPPRGAAAVKLRPEVRRKIGIAYRRGERNHPAIKILVEQLIASASAVGPR